MIEVNIFPPWPDSIWNGRDALNLWDSELGLLTDGTLGRD